MFEYKELEKITYPDGFREYVLPDGSRVPSVTTILSATKSREDQEALDNWRKAVTPRRANAITEEAAARGTRMHSYLEHYVLNGEHKAFGSNPYAKQANEMARVVQAQGLSKLNRIHASEVQLYYPELYSGTTDLIAEKDGELVIVDFKQTNKPKTDDMVLDYKSQLAAYAEAHNKVYGTNIKRGFIMMCSGKMEYQEWDLNGDEFAHFVNEWWRRLELYWQNVLEGVTQYGPAQ